MAGRTGLRRYVPATPCGIATFTRTWRTRAATTDSGTSCAGDPDVYPSEVRHRIRRDTLADYLEVARQTEPFERWRGVGSA